MPSPQVADAELDAYIKKLAGQPLTFYVDGGAAGGDDSRPAAGLTTRCNSLSNGRFGHPDQARALSAREAACLQTFSRSFQFRGNVESMAHRSAMPFRR
jgi:site-specific DNA-cytosine methylase